MSFRRDIAGLSPDLPGKRDARNGAAPRQRGVVARARRFGRDREGAATIEMVVLLPLYLMLIVLAFDIGITFYSLTRMHDVARYTARLASTGELTVAEAEEYAAASLPGLSTFTITIDDSSENDITVSISSDNISPVFGFLEMFSPEELSASYIMRKEWANG